MSTPGTESTARPAPGASGETSAPGAELPVIRVESGSPTPEEIAVLVAVLASAGGDDEPTASRRRSAWSDPSWRLIGPEARAGGWRASGLPH
ncbi:acyl-CoA carboxylase subunit epsilon [Monashia sp. NPDC004114]